MHREDSSGGLVGVRERSEETIDSGLVLYETNGRVATITLNRPDFLNAIISPMWQELNEGIAEANRDGPFQDYSQRPRD